MCYLLLNHFNLQLESIWFAKTQFICFDEEKNVVVEKFNDGKFLCTSGLSNVNVENRSIAVYLE